jgi:hypothetical protein
MLWPIGFQCAAVLIRLDSLVYTYIVDRQYDQLRRVSDIPERNYCLRRAGEW